MKKKRFPKDELTPRQEAKFTLEELARAWDDSIYGHTTAGHHGPSWDSYTYTALEGSLKKIRAKKPKRKGSCA